MNKKKSFVLWFKDLRIKDVPLVGGKNASLGEMYAKLSKKKVGVPNGFAVTAYAYRYLLKKSKLQREIRKTLKTLDTSDMHNLQAHGKAVRDLILGAEFPKELERSIAKAYTKLCQQQGGRVVDVAVRSSATAEDLPDASFAGQQETYLNIRGEAALLDACRKCFASLFTNRAISYRQDKGFNHFKVALSIGVQLMVRSDKASSGVMFSIDTESGFKDAVLVTGAWGLGENVVQGAVNPDQFYVFKPTLNQGYKPILSRKRGAKHIKMVYAPKGSKRPVKNVATTEAERMKYILNDDEILQLAKWAVIIEDHYKKPMDMEWAKDGVTKKLYIVQARPETVQSRKNVNVLEQYNLKQHGEVLVTGRSVGSKIGQGTAHVIQDVRNIHKFKRGSVLVTQMTDPDWEPIMKIASAIVTNRGGRTCHAAIIARELGIPCIVGSNNATKKLRTGQGITVSCAEGELGKVYKGLLKYEVKKTNLKKIPEPKTKIMLNLGNPEEAFSQSFVPNDGVGLAREEFIINDYVKVHPLALLNFFRLKDKRAKAIIEKQTKGYQSKTEYFVERLASGVGTIAAAFYPKDVIVRLSDFKSNEYANLIGGKEFEPVEDNPMIGWRGASRYYSEKYKPAFELECQALKRVRDTMGLTNLKIMIPFCRTLEEGKNVLSIMAKNGLRQGKNDLEVYVMCEIPSNVILAEQFAEMFDGFSIGSNDLTQLTLGLDRDSEIVAHLYDERNPAVKSLLSSVIKTCRKHKTKIGICGDAPSTYPDLALFLAEEGINSMSLTPDALLKTRILVANLEKKLGRRKKKSKVRKKSSKRRSARSKRKPAKRRTRPVKRRTATRRKAPAKRKKTAKRRSTRRSGQSKRRRR